MGKIFSLDIGTASIGYAVLDFDNKTIADLGVHLFSPAQHRSSASGKIAPPASPRRNARSQRRRLRRSGGRREAVRQLCIKHGLIPDIIVPPAYDDGKPADFHPYRHHPAFKTAPGKLDPWTLRAAAVHRLLTGEELARVLLHIVKFRGFKSNRKGGFELDVVMEETKPADEKAEQELGMKKGVRHLAARFAESGCQTIGEFIGSEEFGRRKHNRDKDYSHTIYRDLLEQEVRTIFDRQREFGSLLATDELQEGILQALLYVKPYITADLLKSRIGACTFYPEEIRSPKNTYSAERFNLLSKLNTLNYIVGADVHYLTSEQRAIILEKAYQNAEIKYAQIRRWCNLPDDARFTGLKDTKKKKTPEGVWIEQEIKLAQAEDRRWYSLVGYHSIRKACENLPEWQQLQGNAGQLDVIAQALYFHKNQAELTEALLDGGITASVTSAVVNGIPEGFTGTLHLSPRAITELLPHLEQGMNYYDACQAAGLRPRGAIGPQPDGKLKTAHLPAEITINPVVHRALSKCCKLVNELVTLHGSPEYVHIETARNLRFGAEKRQELDREMFKRQQDNITVDQQLKEYGVSPSRVNREKYRLWWEQTHECPYCGLKLKSPDYIQQPNYAEIDHIIPRSISFDNSFGNKVLVHASCNRNKGNRTARLFIQQDRPTHLEDYLAYCAKVTDKSKRMRLLKARVGTEDIQRWQARHLHDTSTITSTFAQVLQDNLKFDSPKGKRNVVCFQGRIVADVRNWWGLSISAVNKMDPDWQPSPADTEGEPHRKERDDPRHHAIDALVLAALRHHQIELVARHAEVMETRQPMIDLETGELIEWGHESNQRPKLPLPWKGFRTQALALLAQAGDNYNGQPLPERLFISKLPERRMQGSMHRDTIVSLKNGKEKSGMVVRGGLVGYDTGSQLRMDVFCTPRGYKIVPVYVKDVLAGRIPEGDGEFVMSIQKNELIRVVSKDGSVAGYYDTCDPGANRIYFTPVNGKSPQVRKGIATAERLEKYAVSITGRLHKVRKETRITRKKKERD